MALSGNQVTRSGVGGSSGAYSGFTAKAEADPVYYEILRINAYISQSDSFKGNISTSLSAKAYIEENISIKVEG